MISDMLPTESVGSYGACVSRCCVHSEPGFVLMWDVSAPQVHVEQGEHLVNCRPHAGSTPFLYFCSRQSKKASPTSPGLSQTMPAGLELPHQVTPQEWPCRSRDSSF